MMVFLIILISLGFFTIDNCLSMVIPIRNTLISNNTTTTTSSSSTHILHVRIRIDNSLIETLVNKRQLDLIEIQLKEKHIPYHQIQDNKDGITIIIGPFHKSLNLTTTIMMFNQTCFQRNFTKIIPIKIDSKNSTIVLKANRIHSKHFPVSIETHEYNLIHDQESYEFRNCLESCEVYEDNELRPDHDCIRKNCLKEITGI